MKKHTPKFYRKQIENYDLSALMKAQMVIDYVKECRKQNTPISLSNLDLSGIDLSGLDFSRKTTVSHQVHSSEHGSYIVHSLISPEVLFLNTNLQGANLSNCNFGNANMKGANLKGANIEGAAGFGSEFYRNAIKSSVSLEDKTKLLLEYIANCRTFNMNINLSELDLSGVDLSGLDLSKKKIKLSHNCKTCFCDVYEKKICKVHIYDTNFQKANLSNCNFIGAKMSDVNLLGAKTEGACFENNEHAGWQKFYLEKIDSCKNPEEKTPMVREYILNCQAFKCKADLSKWDLSGTDLSYLDLTKRFEDGERTFKLRMCKTNLQGANLTKSNFNGVNMKGSNLKDAITEGTNLENTKQSIKQYKFYREQIELCINSEDKTTLVRAYIKTCYALNKSIDLNNLNLSGIDLSGLDLSKRKVQIARNALDLDGEVYTHYKKKTLKVSIRNTNLKGANLSNCNFTSADMYKTNLEDTITVGAIFEKTKGLINYDDQSNDHGYDGRDKCVIS